MRFTRTQLALKYANRNRDFTTALLLLLLGLIWFLPWYVIIASRLMQFSPILGYGSFLILGLPSVWFITRGVREIRRTTRLIAEGQPALGIIRGMTIETYRGQKWIARVVYVYKTSTPGQEPREQKVDLRSPPYTLGEFEPGQTVLVLYDPENPARNVIDRFDARHSDRIRLCGESRP